MSIAKNSGLLASKPLKVVMHTHKTKAHGALELHVYLMSPHSIGHCEIFEPSSVPISQRGHYITLNALEREVENLRFTLNTMLQTRSMHANGLNYHFIA
jgi:hypothetical protein